jgi:hypothetical protein
MLRRTLCSVSHSLVYLEVFSEHTCTVCCSCDGHHAYTSAVPGRRVSASLMRRMPRENLSSRLSFIMLLQVHDSYPRRIRCYSDLPGFLKMYHGKSPNFIIHGC